MATSEHGFTPPVAIFFVPDVLLLVFVAKR